MPSASRRPAWPWAATADARLRCWSSALALTLLCSVAGWAHETPIALLELRELRPGTYLVNWTYSSSVNLQPPTAVYPEHCQF
jgi:hypothetical protein